MDHPAGGRVESRVETAASTGSMYYDESLPEYQRGQRRGKVPHPVQASPSDLSGGFLPANESSWGRSGPRPAGNGSDDHCISGRAGPSPGCADGGKWTARDNWPLDHNALKTVRKLSYSVGPPGPASPVCDTIADSENTLADAVWHSSTQLRNVLKQTRLTKSLRPRIRRAHCCHI